jgi:hypothetical protein
MAALADNANSMKRLKRLRHKQTPDKGRDGNRKYGYRVVSNELLHCRGFELFRKLKRIINFDIAKRCGCFVHELNLLRVEFICG